MAQMRGTAKLNKKGSSGDILFVGIALLVFAITALFGFMIASQFGDKIGVMDDMPNASKVAAAELEAHYTGTLDNMFLLVLIFLGVGALIMAALVRVHPIFIPVFILAWFILVFMCGVFSNIYTEIASNPEMITYANQLTMATNVVTYLPLIVGVFGILLMILMYKQWKLADMGY
jgi:hypothetical protein